MRSSAGLALLAITSAGGALRAAAAATHPEHVSADQRAYSLLAVGLSQHGRYAAHGLRGQFHWPPGAPFLFALANLFAPAHHVDLAHPHLPAAYVAQVIVGTLTIPAAAMMRTTRPATVMTAVAISAGVRRERRRTIVPSGAPRRRRARRRALRP